MATDTTLRFLAGIDLDVNLSQVQRDWRSVEKSIQKTFSDTVGTAVSQGFKTAKIDAMAKRMQDIQNKINESRVKALDYESKIQLKIQAQADTSAEKAMLAREKLALKGLEERARREILHVDAMAARQKKANEEAERLMARGVAERVEEFGEGIEKAFNNLKGGSFGDFFKNLGAGVSAKGAQMKMIANQGEGLSKVMGTMGKMLSTIGPLVTALGGLAIGIGALAKMFIDADSRVKELNQGLFESGVAASELTGVYGDMSDALGGIQKAFASGGGAFSFNRLWGTTAKDHYAILGAYAQAGLTFKEIREGAAKGATEMERLREATSGALAYSKLLGTSASEMATNMATWMEELGGDLGHVQEGLTAINMAARESGFGVKRFFSMVLQATTGMTMYNVRLEEASGLLVRLGSILGAKMGGDFLQNLTKGFGDESMQDRYKRIQLTGKGRFKGFYERSASSTAKDFLGKVDNKKLDELGLKTSAEGLVKQLGGMSLKDQTAMIASVRKELGDTEAQQLTNLMEVSGGASGNMGRMVTGMGGLDMGGKLAAMLGHGQAVMGGKAIHEMEWEELMGFQGVTGTSTEQIEQLRRISRGLTGNFQDLQKGPVADTEEEMMKQIKAFGAFKDASGAIRTGTIEDGQAIVGDEIKNLGDYIQSQGDVFRKAAEEGQPAAIRLAQEQVSATTQITLALEQGVEWWLIRIHEAIEGFMSLFLGSTETETKNRQAAIDSIKMEMQGQREKERAVGKEIAGLRAKRAGATGADADRLDAEIAKKELERQGLEEAVGRSAEGLRNLMSGPDLLAKRGGTRSAETFKTQALSNAGNLFRKILGDLTSTPEFSDAIREAEESVEKGQLASRGQRAAKNLLNKQRQALMGRTDRYYSDEEMAKRFPELAEAAAGKGHDGLMRDHAFVSELDRLEKQETKLHGKVRDAMTGKTQTWTERFSGTEAEGPSLLETLFGKILAGGGQKLSREEIEGGVRAAGVSGEEGRQIVEYLVEAQEHAEFTPIVDALKDEAVERQRAAEAARIAAEKSEKDAESERGKKPQALAKAVVEHMKKMKEDERLEGMEKVLEMAGLGAHASAWSADLGSGRMPAGLRKHLERDVSGRPLKDRLFDLGASIPSSSKADDFLMHVGGGGQIKFAQRIDSADQVTAVAHKAGGAISRGGGGSGVVHNHFYNDGQGIFASMKRWAQANGG
jgi:hypothetical protein